MVQGRGTKRMFPTTLRGLSSQESGLVWLRGQDRMRKTTNRFGERNLGPGGCCCIRCLSYDRYFNYLFHSSRGPVLFVSHTSPACVWQEEVLEHEDKKEVMKLMMFMERSRKDFLEAKAESDQVTARAVLTITAVHHTRRSHAHAVIKEISVDAANLSRCTRWKRPSITCTKQWSQCLRARSSLASANSSTRSTR